MAQPTHGAPGTGTAVASDAGHKAPFPPFQAESFVPQLLWFAIAFGALYSLMSKVALPRVAETLHARTQRIGKDLDDAQRLREQSEEAGAAYETALNEARDKAKGIAQTTRESLAAEADTRRKALEAELAAKLQDADATIRTRTDAAMANVRDIAADAATAIVERLTGRPPEPQAVRSALDRTLQA